MWPVDRNYSLNTPEILIKKLNEKNEVNTPLLKTNSKTEWLWDGKLIFEKND